MKDKEKFMGKKKSKKKDVEQELEEANERSRSCAGKSIKELVEDRLDEYIDELMDPDAMNAYGKKEAEKIKGIADGLTQAISIFTNPYYPDPDSIRIEAMVRWEERQ